MQIRNHQIRRGRRGWASDLIEAIVRGFSEFLALPTYIIIGFLLLAIGSYLFDSAQVPWFAPVRDVLRLRVFGDAEATSDLLSTVAGSLITVASITISLLLVALQQSASNMTAQVFDQFLRRRYNQVYFGFFIGLALYALVTLATVSEGFNPVYGATLAFLLTVVALYLLIVLLYTTVSQMRPVEVLDAIHDHVLMARERHLCLIRKTRRTPSGDGSVSILVKADREGFVTRIDINAIGKAARQPSGGTETILQVTVGSYVAFQDVLAEARGQTQDEVEAFAKTVRAAVTLERQRDITADPAYGVEQIAMIAWTSISTSKSNPSPGLLAIRALRDIMARWSIEDGRPDSEPLPVVYTDNVFEQLIDTFESLAVVSSESMQHQIFAEVVRTFAIMYPRLPSQHQPRAEDLLLRILSALGDHVLTRELNSALSALLQTLTVYGQAETASLVREARERMAESIGKLNSRSTRVPS